MRPRSGDMGLVVVLALLLRGGVASSLGGQGGASRGAVRCIDSRGRDVDWWVAIKASGSEHYVELTSLDAPDIAADAERAPFSRGLHADYGMATVGRSPMLSTVYGNLGAVDARGSPVDGDTRVFMAWNDQPPDDAERVVRTGDGGRDGPLTGDAEPETAPPSVSGNTRSKRPRVPVEAEQESSDDEEYLNAARGDDGSVPRRLAALDRLSAPKAAKSKGGAGRDMYGRIPDVRSAHSKGMLGLGLEGDTLTGYLLTHSYPATPRGEAWYPDEAVRRRRPPADASRFFGENVRGPQSKAQHAMCVSLRQTVARSPDGEILFDAGSIDGAAQPIFAVLDGLDLIGPSLVMADYVPWRAAHRGYHFLFNVADSWSGSRWLPTTAHENLNAPRAKTAVPSRTPHAFVLWPTACSVAVSSGPPVFRRAALGSVRAQKQYARLRCTQWDAESHAAHVGSSVVWDGRGAGGSTCLVSARIASTAVDGPPLLLTVDYKHGLLGADVDDLIRRHLVPAADVQTASSLGAADSAPRKAVAYVVVVQSWFDHATQGAHEYALARQPHYRAAAWFQNSVACRLPVESGSGPIEGETRAGARHVLQPSIGYNHCKHFVAFPYGPPVRFLAVGGFIDLNRNNKATRLPGRPHGRAGALFATRDPVVVRFLYALQPLFEDTANFAHVDLGSAVLPGDSVTPAVAVSHVGQSTANVRMPGAPGDTPIALPFVNPATSQAAAAMSGFPSPYGQRRPPPDTCPASPFAPPTCASGHPGNAARVMQRLFQSPGRPGTSISTLPPTSDAFLAYRPLDVAHLSAMMNAATAQLSAPMHNVLFDSGFVNWDDHAQATTQQLPQLSAQNTDAADFSSQRADREVPSRGHVHTIPMTSANLGHACLSALTDTGQAYANTESHASTAGNAESKNNTRRDTSAAVRGAGEKTDLAPQTQTVFDAMAHSSGNEADQSDQDVTGESDLDATRVNRLLNVDDSLLDGGSLSSSPEDTRRRDREVSSVRLPITGPRGASDTRTGQIGNTGDRPSDWISKNQAPLRTYGRSGGHNIHTVRMIPASSHVLPSAGNPIGIDVTQKRHQKQTGRNNKLAVDIDDEVSPKKKKTGSIYAPHPSPAVSDFGEMFHQTTRAMHDRPRVSFGASHIVHVDALEDIESNLQSSSGGEVEHREAASQLSNTSFSADSSGDVNVDVFSHSVEPRTPLHGTIPSPFLLGSPDTKSTSSTKATPEHMKSRPRLSDAQTHGLRRELSAQTEAKKHAKKAKKNATSKSKKKRGLNDDE